MTDLIKLKILLGLSSEPATSEEFALPQTDDDIARGYAALAMEPEDLIAQTDLNLLQLAIPAAQSLGFQLASFEANPKILRIWAPDDDFRLVSANDDKPQISAGAPGEFFIDLQRANAPFAIVNQDDEGLVLFEDQHSLQVTQFLRRSTASSFHFDLSSPILEWIDSSDDTWIKELVTSKLTISEPWNILAAIGTFHRLEEIQSSERKQELIQKLLAGQPISERYKVLDWVQTLPAEMTNKLASLTFEAIEQVADLIDQLREDYEAGEEIVIEELFYTFHLRDDVESALILLNATDAKVRLQGATDLIDTIGEELIHDLRLELPILDDERMRRATVTAPDAWWGTLARPLFDDD